MAQAYARLIRTPSLSNVPEKVRSALALSVRKHALLIQRSIRQDMAKPKHGRVYLYRGKPHVASAPGESPAIRSGALWRAVVPQYSRTGLQARFAPKVPGKPPYPRFLEHGTSRMAPRPYLRPGVDRWRQAFIVDARTILSTFLARRR